MDKVEAWPVYEFECPKCHEISQLNDGDFDNDKLENDNGDWYFADCAEFTCKCGETFTVTHD